MQARTWIRWLAPCAVLCGAARSAHADGTAFFGEGVIEALLELGLLLVLGMVGLIVLAMVVHGAVRKHRKAAAAAAARAIPAARVVERKPR